MEVPSMANTKRNIESNKENPEQANQLFSELRLNDMTIAAIKEGRRIALDNHVKSYSTMDSLKKALGV
jgi:hypothetical protein